MDLGIKGRRALVTGGSQGIGKGIAVALAKEGVHVAICARRKEVLQETAAELRKPGVTVFAKSVDVKDPDQVAAMVRETQSALGPIDILVNNAGAGTKAAPFVELSDAEWLESLSLNLLSCIRFSKAVMPQMQQRRWGRIVNISSLAGMQVGSPPVNTLVEYGTNKAGIIALTKYMAEHVAKDNVLVNCICPGPIRTPGAWGSLPQEVVEQRLRSVPMGRLGTMEEVADLALFLCSERCTYITGTAIPIDGGAVRSIR